MKFDYKQGMQEREKLLTEQTTLESLVSSVETYVSLLHDNVVKVVKSLR